jgi:hypothetical protein
MSLTSTWQIQRRAHHCAATNTPFAEGDVLYSLLFQEKQGLRREDLCEAAWKARQPDIIPYYYWKSKYEKPATTASANPEAMPREGVESLLRRLSHEDEPQTLNVRYILVLMLERKRVLKPIDEKPSDEGRILIYEHVKTGEAFLVIDPMLRLDQIDAIQQEIYDRIIANQPTSA